MKIKAENLAILFKMQLLALTLFLPTAFAADQIIKTMSSTTTIESKANFKPAAYILVEHEAFSLSTLLSPTLDVGKVFKKQTYVSVHGAPGETVMYSCNIETLTEKNQKADGSSISKQGCDGSQTPVPQQIASGRRIYNAVKLTSGMFPHEGGPSDSRITIEVSYI